VGFESRAERPLEAWVRGTNSLLSDDIRVRWALPVPSGFHARYSATARRYLYVFVESERPPAIARGYLTWSSRPLDDLAMHTAAQLLIGEHDFSSFRSAACQSKSPYRCIFGIAVRRFDDLVVIDVDANAFLHHMVRNIAAALAEVGRGERDPHWLRDVLLAHDRSRIGATAPPNGLYLFDVSFGAGFGFPRARPPAVLRAAGDVW